MSGIKLSEYLENVKALLRLDHVRWRIVVERQVQVQVLPNLRGTRAELEPLLWELLLFCLEGHDGIIPKLDDESWEKAHEAAKVGTSMQNDDKAAFPSAAIAVALVIMEVREVGLYPPPKI